MSVVDLEFGRVCFFIQAICAHYKRVAARGFPLAARIQETMKIVFLEKPAPGAASLL